MRNRLPLLLVLCCLGFAACDASDPDEGPQSFGSSTIKVEGAEAAEASFDGFAAFTIVTDEGDPYFNLLLTDRSIATEDVAKLVAFQRAGNRPETGTYTIDGEDVLSFYLAEISEDDGVLVGGDEGTLTITRSSDRSIEGSFTFTGVELASGEETTVSGSFKAIYVDDDTAGGVF